MTVPAGNAIILYDKLRLVIEAGSYALVTSSKPGRHVMRQRPLEDAVLWPTLRAATAEIHV